jgi:NADPH-dependent 2,4-dienoyl-CoA reductase/sulfur reductase-like enzyme
MRRYGIVGTGVAGISAISAIRNADPSAEIHLIGEDPHGFYSRPGLAFHLNNEIPEKQLFLFSRKDWRDLNVHYLKSVVTRIAPQAHQVEVGPGRVISYDRLLLATGATAVPLSVPGANLQGVVKLDNLEDARRILALARRGRTAVVVGGGIVAIELIDALVTHGVQVHYFLRGDRYWPNILDVYESRIIEHHLHDDGVHLHYKTEIAEIIGRRNTVAAVRTKSGELIRCGMVAVGIGVKSRLALAQAAGIKTERGILTDETLRTSDPDIFSAGDAAQVFDPLKGEAFQNILWWPARLQGWTAGMNMTGARQAYQPRVTMNITRLAGFPISIMGMVGSDKDEDLVSIARGSSDTWRNPPNSIPVESGSEINHVRLMLGENTILGAMIIGDQKISLPLEDMISHQVDITPIRARLLEPGTPVGDVVLGFWSAAKEKQHAASQ